MYYSIVALVTISLTYMATAIPAGQGLRLFQYSWEQMGWIMITGSFNMIALISKTISNQNEKSGIVAMFGYLGLVYASVFDFFFFDELMNWLEWLGALIIIISVISLTVHMFTKKEEPEVIKT